jgi:hypothetical protein
MEATLKKLGFVTTIVTNVDQMSMEEAIYAFSESVTPSDEVYIFTADMCKCRWKELSDSSGKDNKGRRRIRILAYPQIWF